ncbi:MAG: hypothetical protein QXT63_09390, partial [Thermoplasmata archaeon]
EKPKKMETQQEDLSAFTFSSGKTVEELRKAYEEGRIQKPKIDEEAEADLREYDEMTRTKPTSKPKLESDNEEEKGDSIEKNKEQEEEKKESTEVANGEKEGKKEVDRKQDEKEDMITDKEKSKTELRNKN